MPSRCGESRADFGQQAVAVDVDDVGGRDQRLARRGGSASAPAIDPTRSIAARATALRARDPGHARPRRCRGPAGRRMREVVHASRRARVAHSPSWNGSSALAAWSGGRCGVTWTILTRLDGRPRARRWRRRRVANSANVAAARRARCVANSKKRSSRSQNAASSAFGPVVRAAADDGFARVEEQVEHRLAGRARDRAPAPIMSSSDEYDGRSQRMRATPSFRSTRLVV